MSQNNPISKQIMDLRNAGIVLLNSYIPQLFEQLGLTYDKAFTSRENQLKAVYLIQYAATGMIYADENYLQLNKLLCGLPTDQSLPDDFSISGKEQLVIDGMLLAVMDLWTANGSSSIEGFRGNWLLRDGLLIEKEEKWELLVQKRAYDFIVISAPFNFSVLKFPWMIKPVSVNWPF